MKPQAVDTPKGAPVSDSTEYTLAFNGVLVSITAYGNGYTYEVHHFGALVADGAFPVAAGLRQTLMTLTEIRMPTRASQSALLVLAAQARSGHIHVPARELRAGDVLHVGAGGYVTVHSTETTPRGSVLVSFRNKNGEGELWDEYFPTRLCSLRERGTA